jgi:GNAT superfamily N-acetyltransferase
MTAGIRSSEWALEYRAAKVEDAEAVRRFLAAVGWEQRVQDPDRFRALLEQSDRTVIAWEAGRIVGFARALCDGVSNGYISMVAVAPDRRGRGIGGELVRRLTGDDPAITWVLRAGRGSAGFWEKMGFRHSALAMERTRTAGDAPNPAGRRAGNPDGPLRPPIPRATP